MAHAVRLANLAAAGAILAGAGGFAPRGQAAFIATMEEVGSDVVLMGSGTIDTAGLTPHGSQTTGVTTGIIPSDGSVVTGALPGAGADFYQGYTAPSSFGSGPFIAPSGGTGDRVGIVNEGLNYLLVPLGYVSGSALSGTSTYGAATFASLDVTPGTYAWTWGSPLNGSTDSFTLEIGNIPEPASALLIGLPVAATWLVRRRAKAAAVKT